MTSVSVLVAIEVSENGYREIRKRTSAVGSFPEGKSALMLVCTKLRYVATKDWDTKRSLDMKHLYELEILQEYEREMKKTKVGVA